MTPLYCLTFVVLGAVLSAAVLFTNNRIGSHAGGMATLGLWLLSLYAEGAAIVAGGVLAIFSKTRVPAVALLCAGFGGFLASVAFMLVA